jgi:hypothetical protein
MQLGLRAGFDCTHQLCVEAYGESQRPQRCDNGSTRDIELAAYGGKADLNGFLRLAQRNGRPLRQGSK